jgi:hypothetical protein
MNLMMRILCIGVALSVDSAAGASTPMPRHRLHLAGVSLMMTSGEAIQALRTQHVSVKALIKSACVSDYLAMHRSEVPMSDRGGHCVESLQAVYPGGSLLLYFTKDMPRRPGVSVITIIALNYPTDHAAVGRMIADAGPPSLTDGQQPWTVAMWCFGFTCTDMNKTLKNRYAGPMLVVHQGAGLTLDDTGAGNHRQDEADRVLASHGVRRVP